MDAIKEESVGYLFNLEVSAAEPNPAAETPAVSEPAAEPSTLSASPAPAPPPPLSALSAPTGGAAAQPPRPLLVAKGLVAPRRAALQYSAPTVDGEVATSDGSHTDGAAPEDSDGARRNGAAGASETPANRAQRRRAGRAARKRR
jgi:preprotein translocase subunit SecA